MADYKVSLLCEQSTAPDDMEDTSQNIRDGGWSENYYLVAADASQANSRMIHLATARAGMLPDTAQVVGWRITPLANPGLAFAVKREFPGASNLVCDVPQMALLTTGRATNGAKRSVIFRGIPDARVVGGTFSSARTWRAALSRTLSVLGVGFGLRGINRTNPLLTVSSITIGGLTTTLEAHGLLIGDTVAFFRTRDVYRQPVTGRWTVATVPSALTFTLVNYGSFGDVIFGAVNKGKVRKIASAISAFSSWEVGNIVMRKVGRPFDLYRGRVSTRR